tara:strand:- start:715 stop:1083 length:369 start_codon:yes stop_codon:yes gene_type:complete
VFLNDQRAYKKEGDGVFHMKSTFKSFLGDYLDVMDIESAHTSSSYALLAQAKQAWLNQMSAMNEMRAQYLQAQQGMLLKLEQDRLNQEMYIYTNLSLSLSICLSVFLCLYTYIYIAYNTNLF